MSDQNYSTDRDLMQGRIGFHSQILISHILVRKPLAVHGMRTSAWNVSTVHTQEAIQESMYKTAVEV